MEKQNINCVGFIMDGNRRWAKDQGLPTLEGHRQGTQILLDSFSWISEAGIKNAIYYTFSTENWRRSEDEVGYLMDLFTEYLNQVEEKINQGLEEENRIRLRVVGRINDFSPELQAKIKEVEDKTKNNQGGNLWLAMSYGGRAEIVQAVNKAVAEGQSVDEDSFAKLLWTADMPDPDLIIRTGGDLRLSNFMTWQSVYSELFFIKTYWPALTKNDFTNILDEYAVRERRRGK
jgi:undecaprenyl diphosphate synthase